MAIEVWTPAPWEIALYSAHNIRVLTERGYLVCASDYNESKEMVHEWLIRDSRKWEVFRACQIAARKGAQVERVFILPRESLSDERLCVVLAAQVLVKINVKVLALEDWRTIQGYGFIPDFAMILGPPPHRHLIKGVQWEPNTPNHRLLLREHKELYQRCFDTIWNHTSAYNYEQLLRRLSAHDRSLDVSELIVRWKEEVNNRLGQHIDQSWINDWADKTKEILSGEA